MLGAPVEAAAAAAAEGVVGWALEAGVPPADDDGHVPSSSWPA